MLALFSLRFVASFAQKHARISRDSLDRTKKQMKAKNQQRMKKQSYLCYASLIGCDEFRRFHRRHLVRRQALGVKQKKIE